ncbi:hypothetical protein F383_38055 [Gossypium arboreum]|uniref:Uncharacterized protein n=1 Tax=Gossypium arboreum TaxID=29729 RepID=A0A0B0M9V4_GOSAR|nr:hypothetical protein F383_38055 [Gossypium arboreum]
MSQTCLTLAYNSSRCRCHVQTWSYTGSHNMADDVPNMSYTSSR